MKANQDYRIFTADGRRHTVNAPSLRRAVRVFEKTGKGAIVAACEVACMPEPSEAARPFIAVFMKDPDFIPPEDLG